MLSNVPLISDPTLSQRSRPRVVFDERFDSVRSALLGDYERPLSVTKRALDDSHSERCQIWS